MTSRPISAQQISNNLRVQSLDPGNLSVEADRFKDGKRTGKRVGDSSSGGLSRSRTSRRSAASSSRRRGHISSSSDTTTTTSSSSSSRSGSSSRTDSSSESSSGSNSYSSDSSDSSDYADSTHDGKYWHRKIAPVVPANGGRPLREEDFTDFKGPLHQPLPPKSAIPVMNGGSASGSSLLMARLALHKGYPYSEPATVFEWSATYKSWCPRQTRLIVSSQPFSEGAMRASYYVIDLEAPHVLFVGKRYRKRNVRSGQYFNDASMHWVSNHWADNFNRFLPPKRVEFVPAAVAQLPMRSEEKGRTFVLGLEPYLAGTFRKYNNNSGFVSAAAQRSTPQAFSHFTFHYSCGELMIVDIQGVDDAYTDPQILTRDGEGYGRGNLGSDGMRRFFKSHRCNAVCEYMRLPNMRAMQAKQQRSSRGESDSKGVAESFSTSSDDSSCTTTSTSDSDATSYTSTTSSRSRSRENKFKRRGTHKRDTKSKSKSKSKITKNPSAPSNGPVREPIVTPNKVLVTENPKNTEAAAVCDSPAPKVSVHSVVSSIHVPHRRSVSFQRSPLGDQPIPATGSPIRGQSIKVAPTEEELIHTSVVLSRFQEIMLGRLSVAKRGKGEGMDAAQSKDQAVLSAAIAQAAAIPTQSSTAPVSASTPVPQRLSPGAMDSTPSPNSAPMPSASPILDRPKTKFATSDPTAHLPETMMRHNSVLATSSHNLKLVLQQAAALGDIRDSEKVIISNRLIAPATSPQADGPASPHQPGSTLNTSAAALNLPPGFEQLASPLGGTTMGIGSPLGDAKVESSGVIHSAPSNPSRGSSSRPLASDASPKHGKKEKIEKREKKGKP